MDNEAIGIAIHLHDLLEKEFTNDRAGPCTMLAVKARRAAIDATRALIDADADDTSRVRSLQSDIKRYRELIGWMRDIIATGKEAFHDLEAAERESVLKALNQEVTDQ